MAEIIQGFEMVKRLADKKGGWSVLVNGSSVANVLYLELQSKFGTLSYGQRPEDYDSWVFREANGGGAITLPYSILPTGHLFVGLIPEKRFNMGPKPVYCIIGGFVDPGETHDEAQVREADEETGLNTEKADRLVGRGINANRAFFVADDTKGEGVHAYGLRIPFENLELQPDNTYRLRQPEDSSLQKGANVEFMEVFEAIRHTPDALALSAIAQLMVFLEEDCKWGRYLC